MKICIINIYGDGPKNLNMIKNYKKIVYACTGYADKNVYMFNFGIWAGLAFIVGFWKNLNMNFIV